MTPPLSLSERLMTNLHSWLKTLEQKLLTREKVRIPSLIFKSSPPMWNDDSTSLPTNAEHAVLRREPLCNCLNLNPIFARMSHCSLFDIQITDWWRIMTMMRRINHNTRIVHFWSFSRGIGIDKMLTTHLLASVTSSLTLQTIQSCTIRSSVSSLLATTLKLCLKQTQVTQTSPSLLTVGFLLIIPEAQKLTDSYMWTSKPPHFSWWLFLFHLR